MMKFRTLIISIAVIVATHNSFGQIRKITADELEHLKAVSKYKALHVPVRITTSSTGYEPGTSSQLVREIDADGSEHSLLIGREDGKESREETIHIGYESYILDSGKWYKGATGMDMRVVRRSGSDGPSIEPEITLEHSYVGSEKIGGRNVDHYRKIIIRKYAAAGMPTQRTTEDYWFAIDGIPIRESFEDMFEKTTKYLKRVTVYDYDKKIKITAPVID
jgi:hypothetical protein